MNKEKFLIEARKLIRAKYDHNKDAAEKAGISAAHLCNVLNGKVEKVPQAVLDLVGFRECETEYKKVKS
jgi:DNA-binding Xre family transcriptional regulator